MATIAAHPRSPWHEGEIALQASIGRAERMDALGRRAIRSVLIEQHQDFFPMLPFAVFGTVDPAGDVWATLRAGYPGFLHAPDDMHLAVDLVPETADPASAGMGNGDAIGLLGIELPTRRRNRLNGVVRRDQADGFTIDVRQSYGNCPQYISTRPVTFRRDPHVPSAIAPVVSDALDARARALIAQADTFFVATYADFDDGKREVDVSHRGGPSGFVRIGDDGALTVPDYSGNKFFNTLGNMLANPRAGLVFVDFATGDLLQMTGRTQVILDAPEIASFKGAERLWRFEPEKVVFRAEALPLSFGRADH